MALDFSILSRQPSFAESYMAGQQEAQRNALAQQQMQMQQQQMAAQRENILAQQQERQAHAEERRVGAARRQEEDVWLGKMADLFGQNNVPLTPETVQQGLAFALRSRNPAAIQMMQKTAEAMQTRQQQLEDEARASAELARIRGVPAGAAPSVMRQSAVALPAAPATPTNLLAGTPYDIGMAAPAAPVNALAAPAAPVSPEFTREQVQQMMVSPSARVREQGAALARTLTKEAKQPTDLEVMQQLGFPLTKEGYAAYQATKRQPAPSTTVVIPPQEKAEQSKRGELLVKQYGDVSKAALLAAKTLPSIETQQRILDSGFKTGFGTETQKAGASVLAALGVPEAEKYATDAQAFLSATQAAVLQKQLEQKGTQTKNDAERIEQTAAQLGNTPSANKFILSAAKAQLKRDIDQRNFYDKWWKTNKTYDGAEDAWFSGEGGKSLFDQPELKQYAGAAPKAPQQAAGRAAPMSANAFADADKERRYQEWKAKQGLK